MSYGTLKKNTENTSLGYSTYEYVEKDETYKFKMIKTNPSTMNITPAISTTRVSITDLNPPTGICSTANVFAKTNANYLDATGGKSFYGVFLATLNSGSKILSKDGLTNLSTTSSALANSLGEGTGGWFRYSPAFCIDSDNNARINWFSAQSGSDRMTISQAYTKYKTIISGQHCLVFNGNPVFESTPVYSFQGVTIANWDNLKNIWNHHNEILGGENSLLNTRRTLLGHTSSKNFLLIVVEGVKDLGYSGTSGILGMDLKVASHLMKDLGCDYAINMDGGSPTQMIVSGSYMYPLSVNERGYFIGSAVCAYKK